MLANVCSRFSFITTAAWASSSVLVARRIHAVAGGADGVTSADTERTPGPAGDPASGRPEAPVEPLSSPAASMPEMPQYYRPQEASAEMPLPPAGAPGGDDSRAGSHSPAGAGEDAEDVANVDSIPAWGS